MSDYLPTEPYKGTRDFYPEDMAIQRYIFDTWAKTAELFGYERYDASVLEPAELYKAKGAENEEIVDEQTYLFTDRGDREVVLRPEMTPSVARMVAAKRRELAFPVRWYSIPNLFRYERPQRGRLREHWQLNCDLFGSDAVAADIEIIALAYRTLATFGATPDMFEIRVSDRGWLNSFIAELGLEGRGAANLIALFDKRGKVDDFDAQVTALVGRPVELPSIPPKESTLLKVITGLNSLGIKNVVFSPTTVRGFNYYTETVFEVFDTSPNNNRAILGGGRYDNLTGLFGGDHVPGVGFGMGDVTMRDFLETHGLLPASIARTAPTLVVAPTEERLNEKALEIAEVFRDANVRTSVDISDRKLGKKIGVASERKVAYILVVGPDEVATNTYTLKNLATGEERSGTPETLASQV
jgi:histidyl-tRNA synthetase